MTLDAFWNAAKELSITNAGGIAHFKRYFTAWLNEVAMYGAVNSEQLRSQALTFGLSRREFADLINQYLEETRSHSTVHGELTATICPRCNQLEWTTALLNTYATGDQSQPQKVCQHCARTYYAICGNCGHYHPTRSTDGHLTMVRIQDWAYVCPTCFPLQPSHICFNCGNFYLETGGHIYCYSRAGRYDYVDDPQGSVWFCTSCRAPERSRCLPKHPEFKFPALNLGREDKSVAQDEIFEIATGGGDVNATGLQEIYNLVAVRTKGNGRYGLDIRELIAPEYNFDTRWMTKEGNMPKRIAKLLVSTHHLKLTEELMSEIGNIAQRYTSKPGNYRLSITRNVNRPRTEFVNGDSCWWTNYWYSRCTLKSLGGFGLRTWNDDDQAVGRAWMIPMAAIRTTLVPAPEMLPADAYIVFNGYGPNNSRLDSMEFARMIAAMTGKSYRKIDLSVDSRHYMYVNGTLQHEDSVGKGILVAPQEVCDLHSAFALRTLPNQCSCPGRPRV